VIESSTRDRSAILVTALVILGALCVIQTCGLIWILFSYARTTDQLSDTLGDFLDAQIDAGPEVPLFSSEDPLLQARKVLLFHDVNSRTAKDVSARLMYLNATDPDAPIDLYISTQGGWTDNAFTIIDTMRVISAPVNTWAIGGCYSAGALILAAATGRRYATEDTVLMIHTNLEDSRDAYSFPRLARERYERVYRETTHLPENWYPMTDDQSRYLNPQEALEFHLVDEVVPMWDDSKTLPGSR